MLYLYIYLSMLVGAICTLIAMTAMRRGETHNVGKFGWMLLILLTPPIGLILFLWLGGRKISAEHQRRDRVSLPQTDDSSACSNSRLAEHGVKRGLALPCASNRVVLLDSPEKIYEHLFEVVDYATQRLFIHTFILIDEDLSKKLIDRLCQQASRGLDVRLMIDGFGSATFPDEPLQRLRDAGGHATRFKPLANLSRFAYLNFRNHRKIVVADGTRAILGGANLVEYEITDQPDADTWIDLSLRIDGAAATQIEAVFVSDWEFVGGTSMALQDTSEPAAASQHSDATTAVQVVPIGPDGPEEIIDDLWLTAISQARERLWIVTPYFVPPPVAQRMLTMAVRRGIDVRIIVPDVSDMKPADYARHDYFRELEQHGAKLFRHPTCIIHAKVVLVDTEAVYVGSANFDFRSFFLNYELVAGIFTDAKIREIAEWFERLQHDCTKGNQPDTWRHRILGTLFRLVAAEL